MTTSQVISLTHSLRAGDSVASQAITKKDEDDGEIEKPTGSWRPQIKY